MTPQPGDLWAWPDGRLAFLTQYDIVRGYVVVRYAGRDIKHRIGDGRVETSPSMIAVATRAFGASDDQ